MGVNIGSTVKGPAWLGLGAQRSGTTWFTDLLVQHPQVSYGRSGKKEMHALYRGLVAGHDLRSYLEEFDGLVYAGECTPAYLRCVWTAPVVRDLASRPVLFVLLRDPVTRFESAVRLNMATGGFDDWGRLRDRGADAVWAGMYADQLDAWASVVGRERLIVLQYERVRLDPVKALAVVWGRLGLEPTPVGDVERPSATSSRVEWRCPPDLVRQLREVYRPQLERLRGWGVDPTLWSATTGSTPVGWV